MGKLVSEKGKIRQKGGVRIKKVLMREGEKHNLVEIGEMVF